MRGGAGPRGGIYVVPTGPRPREQFYLVPEGLGHRSGVCVVLELKTRGRGRTQVCVLPRGPGPREEGVPRIPRLRGGVCVVPGACDPGVGPSSRMLSTQGRGAQGTRSWSGRGGPCRAGSPGLLEGLCGSGRSRTQGCGPCLEGGVPAGPCALLRVAGPPSTCPPWPRLEPKHPTFWTPPRGPQVVGTGAAGGSMEASEVGPCPQGSSTC